MQAFRSLIVITVIVTLGSFYFQNNVGPDAQKNLTQLLLSMKQKKSLSSKYLRVYSTTVYPKPTFMFKRRIWRLASCMAS